MGTEKECRAATKVASLLQSSLVPFMVGRTGIVYVDTVGHRNRPQKRVNSKLALKFLL